MDKLEKVAQAIAESDGNEWDTCYPVQREEYLDNARAASAALEPMNKPRVKPLAWCELGDRWNTVTSGRIQITQHGCCPNWSLSCASPEVDGIFPTLEAAKAAGADYEARILAALE